MAERATLFRILLSPIELKVYTFWGLMDSTKIMIRVRRLGVLRVEALGLGV